MKTKVLSILILMFGISNVKATDLIVEEYGAPSTYSSITAAITAATSGDRIIIKNRAGQLPWIENLVISKSLTLMSGQEDTTFLLDGTIDIVPTQNAEVSIIGAHIFNNKAIFSSFGSIPSRSMEVKLYNCRGFNGSVVDVTFSTGIHATIVGCDLGKITLKTGDLFGNKLTQLHIENSSSSSMILDTCYIIGNHIEGYNSYSSSLKYYTNDELLMLKNNKIVNTHSGAYSVTLQITNTETHKIYNNTLEIPSSSGSVALRVYGSNTCEVVNNILRMTGGNSGYSIKDQGGYATINAFYNYMNGTVTGVENNLQQVTSDTAPDTGNPAVVFTDTDLTRNDIGITGGPYPISNYFDSNFNLRTGSTTIFFVQHSIFISQSSAFNIKAFSYDK